MLKQCFMRPLQSYLLAACLALSPLNAPANLPSLGDPTLGSFSTRQEEQLGLAFYRSLRANLEFVNDLQINYYLSTLGNRLASQSDAAGNTFNFFMINAPTINAFAGPAAYIGVHSKLFITADNESQLASVIAHEIAHVSQRHLARRFDESGNSTAITLATLLAAILVGAQDSQAGQAILLGGIAGSQQSSINFTRQNEYEADRVGIGILARGGINPTGMVEFFETLLAQSPDNGLEYLRTHPLNENRVSEARGRITDETRELPSDSLDFEFARARLIILVSDKPERYTDDKVVGTGMLGQYQKALALTRSGQAGKAISILARLSREHNHLWLRMALADAYTANRQDNKALDLLETLSGLYPGHLPVTMAYAKALLTSKQPVKSISLLKQQLQYSKHLQPQDYATIYEALAQAYFANGQISAALEATGNQYARQGYLELAIQQYDNALMQENNSASTIERLKSIKKEIKQEVARLKDIF